MQVQRRLNAFPRHDHATRQPRDRILPRPVRDTATDHGTAESACAGPSIITTSIIPMRRGRCEGDGGGLLPPLDPGRGIVSPDPSVRITVMNCRCREITQLNDDEHLEQIDIDASGCIVHYRCPDTGAGWVRDWLRSEQHGGA